MGNRPAVVGGMVILLVFPFAPCLAANSQADTTAARIAAARVEARQKAEVALRNAAQGINQVEGKSGPEATQFKGINFGIGIGVSSDFGNNVVQKVELIQDTVRVTEKKSALPRVLLESHYFVLTPNEAKLGIGPFVAIQAGGSDLIEAMGAGVIVGWRRTTRRIENGQDKLDDSSFNIGLGVVLDNKAQVIRDGLTENRVAPTGLQSTELTRETSQWGLLVTFSFTP